MFLNIFWILPLISVSAYSQNHMLIEKGQLFFYQDKIILNYNINLNAYLENAKLLQNASNFLIEKCEVLNHKNCQFFTNHLNQNIEIVEKDIKRIFLKAKSRPKRDMKNILTAVSPMHHIPYVFYGMAATTKMAWENQLAIAKQHKVIQEQLNVTQSNMIVQNQLLADSHNKTKQLIDKINDMESINKNLEEFNNVLHVATISMAEHVRNTDKLIHICNDDINSNFFKIIDIDSFSKDIFKINSTLKNLTLPMTEAYNLINFASIQSNINTTHAIITIKLPAIPKTPKMLFEFIPLPFKNENNETFILYGNSKILIMNETNVTILPSFDKCSNIDNLTICNSIIEDTLEPIDECTYSIIKNITNKTCKFKEIISRNYIIRISNSLIYCFIINPLQIKIICNDYDKFYNLTHSKIIDLNNNCEVYKMMNEFFENITSTNEVEIQNPFYIPEFQLYDPNSENWTVDFEIIDKGKIELIKLIKKVDSIRDNYLNNTTKFNVSSVSLSFGNITSSIFSTASGMWNNVTNFISNIFDLPSIILKGLGIGFAILFLYEIFKCILNRRFR